MGGHKKPQDKNIMACPIPSIITMTTTTTTTTTTTMMMMMMMMIISTNYCLLTTDKP